MEELRKQLETRPEGKDLDKDQVARLATMLKQLGQFKSSYKQATDEAEKSELKGKVTQFTSKWLDEKLLQLSATSK